MDLWRGYDELKPPPSKDGSATSSVRRGRPPGVKREDTPALILLQCKFGADLKAARTAADMSQTDVARVLGTGHSTISKIEAGSMNLTMAVMQRLAVAVQCSLVLHLNPDGAPASVRLERNPPKT